MTEIRLQNPYMDETIRVMENFIQIAKMLEELRQGGINYLKLKQIEPEIRLITINPKNFAKVEIHGVEEV